MKKPKEIIEIEPYLNQKACQNTYKHKTKENIINFDLFKKYQIILVTC